MLLLFFFFQAEDGIRDDLVTGVQTCALPILEVMGLNVTSIQNLDKQNFDCKVVSMNADLAIKIAKIFNCEVNLKTPANNFDVEINLGVKFEIGRASCRERV